MTRIFSYFLAVAITGCASASVANIDTHAPVNICQIRDSEELYLGKTVRLSARIKTDLRHYTFLEDPSCGGKTQLNLGRVRGNAEYEELRKSWLVACEATGSPGICVIDEYVDVVGAIRRSDEGYLVLDVVNIKGQTR